MTRVCIEVLAMLLAGFIFIAAVLWMDDCSVNYVQPVFIGGVMKVGGC